MRTLFCAAVLAACCAACSENSPGGNTSEEGPSTALPPATSKDSGLPRKADAGRTSDAGRAETAGPDDATDQANDTADDDTADTTGGASAADAATDATVRPGPSVDAGRDSTDAGSAASATCPATALKPSETTATIDVGGAKRTFILHVPTGYDGKSAVPLVLDWHGLMSSGSGQRGVSGYRALSDKEGFIVAWPNGLDSAWNVGPCVAFARAIVDDIGKRACVDRKRVFSTGFSMGGGMSHMLACNAADVFASVAPAAFDLLVAEEQPCKPARPISVILFRGTSDPLVTYAGGASMPPNGLNVTIHFQGAEGTFKTWSGLNGCTGTPTDTGAGCKTYSQCKEGTEVTLCTKQGGSHEPGDAVRGWETLKTHPMP